MEAHEKIKQSRVALGLTQVEFANALGVSQNDVSKIEGGQRKFIPNTYIAFLIDQGYDIHTLFDDKAQLKKRSSEELFASEPNAEFILRTDKRLDKQVIPLYNLEASAGLVDLFQHYNEKIPIDFISIPNLPKCDGAIFITGDSMYPLLKSGDIVMYKQIYNIQEGIFWGEMYLISVQLDDEEYISVKYIQKSDKGEDYIKMVSQNGNHQSKDIHKDRIRALAMIKASVRINAMR